jgi:hypothetical protein
MLKLLRSSTRATQEFTEQVNALARRMGIRNVELRVVEGIESPFIWCLHRSMLLWPAKLSDKVSGDSLQGLIIHELAHLKRRDPWVGWLELAAGCVWWWNPLYWLVRNQLRLNAELACDAWVVNILDAVPKSRRAYAEALLAVCEHIHERRRAIPMTAIGVDTGSRRFLERRLTMILRERVALRLPRLGMLVVILLASIVLPAWSMKTVQAGRPTVAAAQARQTVARPTTPATTPPTPAPAPAQGLPSDAQEVMKEFESQQAEIRRNSETAIAQQRQQVIEKLQALQDTYTRAGKLDEAVAVRDQLRRIQGNAPAVIDAAEAALERRMPQISFSNTPLKQALEYLRDSAGVNMYVHWKALKEENVGEATPINLKVRDISLSRALELTLRDATGDDSLGFGIEGGVIEITTRFFLTPASFEFPPGTAEVFPPINDLTGFRGDVGKTVRVQVTGSVDTTRGLWGTEVYTDDSNLGVAAVHAGLLKPGQKGVAVVRILPGQSQYQGSTKNGLRSNSFRNYPGSYSFEGIENVEPWSMAVVEDVGTPVEILPGQFILATGLSFGNSYPGPIRPLRENIGESFEIAVIGHTDRLIWGDGIYTDDSDPGTAAVHAGLLKSGQEGRVRITILPGQTSYEGTRRNGVESRPYGSFGGSYRIEVVK